MILTSFQLWEALRTVITNLPQECVEMDLRMRVDEAPIITLKVYAYDQRGAVERPVTEIKQFEVVPAGTIALISKLPDQQATTQLLGIFD